MKYLTIWYILIKLKVLKKIEKIGILLKLLVLSLFGYGLVKDGEVRDRESIVLLRFAGISLAMKGTFPVWLKACLWIKLLQSQKGKSQRITKNKGFMNINHMKRWREPYPPFQYLYSSWWLMESENHASLFLWLCHPNPSLLSLCYGKW